MAALAYRARQGLRMAYLQVHVAGNPPDGCRPTVDRLGGWTRGSLSGRETDQVREHLDNCERCRGLADELADVNRSLRVFLAPLVLGVPAGTYLAGYHGHAPAKATETSETTAAPAQQGLLRPAYGV
ncbi:zf-HC2 domain-containing protein [Saccharopolyspora erythraea]|uniref:zf-HC2 domain-containing protein n=1 Tax=Saccharopolyspora erythraea TaxID=1836 RepID=UPI0020110365|nr:zf-HC2 domain-containing protein [Saccharopolyspora erythraea]